tara:strand:- start:363 stop:560 length:198 start_codon:yes stop_codon:yes gene_type:complete
MHYHHHENQILNEGRAELIRAHATSYRRRNRSPRPNRSLRRVFGTVMLRLGRVLTESGERMVQRA